MPETKVTQHEQHGKWTPQGWDEASNSTLGALLEKTNGANRMDMKRICKGLAPVCEGKDPAAIIRELLLTVLQIETDGEYLPTFKNGFCIDGQSGEVVGSGMFSGIGTIEELLKMLEDQKDVASAGEP